MQIIINKISNKLSISTKQVNSTLELLDGGATIPFIARYRKEATGGLDEVQIGNIKDFFESFSELEKRREFVLNSIEQQGQLTENLKNQIANAEDINVLEDLYLPFKKKKKSKATKAKEAGLEPLAILILRQEEVDLKNEAAKYISEEILTIEDALAGARDIIAELINEDTEIRSSLRTLYEETATISANVIKSKQEEASKYKDYFKFAESLKKIPSHRYLAIRRGESDGFLKVSIKPKLEQAYEIIGDKYIHKDNQTTDQILLAIDESFNRLLSKSLETEFAGLAKEKADNDAINVFTLNLRQLLLAAPLGDKRVVAVDPGFRTGCKIVALDSQGNLLDNSLIYIVGNTSTSVKIFSDFVTKYKPDAIAIGNGTASRETETFIRDMKLGIDIFVVSEDGASIYSASEVAREEFPDKDVTVRGAISIGRRLIDPLSELVKIDPKSIGVGQYQHDVDQSKLKKSLDITVESSVNLVGVNVNSASKHILTYISGLGPKLAQNIVDYRTKNGSFKSRNDLKKVPKLGSKAFEQSAGFLRIDNAKNPLDNSSVHPESYKVVELIVKDLGITIQNLIGDEQQIEKIQILKYVTDSIGIPTLEDIINELKKPARDPRGEVEVFEFKEGINEIENLKIGMVLPGIVTNITNFGAFVDIGVHSDGLVHISQLSNSFVSNPSDVVSLQQKVKVKVTEIDLDRKRIALSMKDVD